MNSAEVGSLHWRVRRRAETRGSSFVAARWNAALWSVGAVFFFPLSNEIGVLFSWNVAWRKDGGIGFFPCRVGFCSASCEAATGCRRCAPVLALQASGAGSVRLDGPWQFHTGDDHRWASPSFDDSAWEPIQVSSSWGSQAIRDIRATPGTGAICRSMPLAATKRAMPC